jgi:Ca-activated chloride channel family protein
MKNRLLSLFIIGLLLAGIIPAAAQGIIVPQPGVFTDPSWLRVDYHRVDVEIIDQIASTHVDLQFTNTGEALAEGTFIFPLPAGATVDQLTMFIDGQGIEAQILPADEARDIYNAIVQQYRDPALLEYIGTSAIQASVFPIPPGESRQIEIRYGQVLEAENGLIQYVYPLNSPRAMAARAVESMSIRVTVEGGDEISSIYSPSHSIAVAREGDTGFSAGFEASSFIADGDFSLFYGLADGEINVNLLTYRESAGEDGFFLLLVQPPFEIDEDEIVAKDVIIVLDQSGSMQGEKWEQAQDAAAYVLDNLNAQDRFNVIVFSTGARLYSESMEGVDEAQDAIDWIDGLDAEGGTNIDLALQNALDVADGERQTTILFLTDGLATEGVIETPAILDNFENRAGDNVRLFAFGIGDDVDTFLLDSLYQAFRGAGEYVRTGERIDEAVAALYNKVGAPVLTGIELAFEGVRAELVYPAELPDLFVGEQLTIVGRFRDAAEGATITLSGDVEDDAQTFIYDGLEFRDNAGGEPFIARLWATRRIGDLLNTIRLQGENPELVDSVISLSLRYGIITPYTSFLITEDDILTQAGQEAAAAQFEADEAQDLARQSSGAVAVDNAQNIIELNAAEAPAAMPTQTVMGGAAGEQTPGQSGNAITSVGGRTFVNIGGVWNDTTYDPDAMTTEPVEFLSDAYFALLAEHPELAEYFALGENVIVVLDGVAYEVVSAAE